MQEAQTVYRVFFMIILIAISCSGCTDNDRISASSSLNGEELEASKLHPCFCNTDSTLTANIDCREILFDNGSKLYWSYNCDSSWLTFENKAGLKKSIFSLDSGLALYSGRLGYAEFFELENTFLVTNRVISGCCEPDDYFLYDKNTGEMINYLGRSIYVPNDRSRPIFIGITGSKYDTSANFTEKNSLSITNLNTNTTSTIVLPQSYLNHMSSGHYLFYPETMFEVLSDTNDTLYFKLSYYANQEYGTEPVFLDTIKIPVSQYLK